MDDRFQAAGDAPTTEKSAPRKNTGCGTSETRSADGRPGAMPWRPATTSGPRVGGGGAGRPLLTPSAGAAVRPAGPGGGSVRAAPSSAPAPPEGAGAAAARSQPGPALPHGFPGGGGARRRAAPGGCAPRLLLAALLHRRRWVPRAGPCPATGRSGSAGAGGGPFRVGTPGRKGVVARLSFPFFTFFSPLPVMPVPVTRTAIERSQPGCGED